MRKWLMAAMLVPAAGLAAVPAFARPAASTPNTVHITALPSGYQYNAKSFSASAGPVTIVFVNHSTRPHDVALEQGETEYGATVTIGQGITSTILTLKKGTYHFYSSVGHDEDKGMSGTLTVK
jgi:plastocyanin